jgi:hypothetical protein
MNEKIKIETFDTSLYFIFNNEDLEENDSPKDIACNYMDNNCWEYEGKEYNYIETENRGDHYRVIFHEC